jgi:hypothetical protein
MMSKARRRRYYVRWCRYDDRCIATVGGGSWSRRSPAVILPGIGKAAERVMLDARRRSVRRQTRVWEP